MEVQLTEDQLAFVRQGIESGRYAREADAVRDAMALWEERERGRMEILAAVAIAEAAAARGEGVVVTNDEEASLLFQRIRAEGMRRLAANANNR